MIHGAPGLVTVTFGTYPLDGSSTFLAFVGRGEKLETPTLLAEHIDKPHVGDT